VIPNDYPKTRLAFKPKVNPNQDFIVNQESNWDLALLMSQSLLWDQSLLWNQSITEGLAMVLNRSQTRPPTRPITLKFKQI
jgi:hypothetical protein